MSSVECTQYAVACCGRVHVHQQLLRPVQRVPAEEDQPTPLQAQYLLPGRDSTDDEVPRVAAGPQTKVLYRGMTDVEMDLKEFQRVGGTELTMMSTTEGQMSV